MSCCSVTCEVDFLGIGTKHERNATVSVNSLEGKEVSFLLSGYERDRKVMKGYRVKLGGFDVGEGTWFGLEIVGVGIKLLDCWSELHAADGWYARTGCLHVCAADFLSHGGHS